MINYSNNIVRKNRQEEITQKGYDVSVTAIEIEIEKYYFSIIS